MASIGEVLIQVAVDGANAVGAFFDTLSDEAQGTEKDLMAISDAASQFSDRFTSVFQAAEQQYMSFSGALNTFRAVTGASEQDMESLTENVRALGMATTQTPEALANAASQLGRMGYTVEEVNASLGGFVSAAEASGETLETSSSIISSALVQFGLTRDFAQNASDILVTGANNSATSLSGLGSALVNVGTQAGQAGLSLEETTATLMLLAQGGEEGERGGTALAAMLRELQNPGEQAAAVLEDYSIAVRDAEGNMLPIIDIVRNFEQGLGSLNPAARDAAMGTVFGAEAIRAMNIAISQGSESLAEFTQMTTAAGGASARTSEQMLEGMTGAAQLMEGSLGLLMNDFYETFAGVFELIERATIAVINGFLRLPEPIRKFAFVVVGVVGAGSAALVAIVAFAFAVTTVQKGVIALAATVGKLQAAFLTKTVAVSTATKAQLAYAASLGATAQAEVAAGVAGAADDFVDLGQSVNRLRDGLGRLGRRLGGLGQRFSALFQQDLGALFTDITSKSGAASTTLRALGKSLFTSVAAGFKAAWTAVAAFGKAMMTMVGVLAPVLIKIGLVTAAVLAVKAAFDSFRNGAQATRERTRELGEIAESLGQTFEETGDEAKTFYEIVTDAFGAVVEAIKNPIETITSLVRGIAGSFAEVMEFFNLPFSGVARWIEDSIVTPTEQKVADVEVALAEMADEVTQVFMGGMDVLRDLRDGVEVTEERIDNFNSEMAEAIEILEQERAEIQANGDLSEEVRDRMVASIDSQMSQLQDLVGRVGEYTTALEEASEAAEQITPQEEMLAAQLERTLEAQQRVTSELRDQLELRKAEQDELKLAQDELKTQIDLQQQSTDIAIRGLQLQGAQIEANTQSMQRLETLRREAAERELTGVESEQIDHQDALLDRARQRLEVARQENAAAAAAGIHWRDRRDITRELRSAEREYADAQAESVRGIQALNLSQLQAAQMTLDHENASEDAARRRLETARAEHQAAVDAGVHWRDRRDITRELRSAEREYADAQAASAKATEALNEAQVKDAEAALSHETQLVEAARQREHIEEQIAVRREESQLAALQMEREILAIKQSQDRLGQEMSVFDAEIAVGEAEIGLTEAQQGGDEEEIEAAERALELRKLQLEATASQAELQNRAHQAEREAFEQTFANTQQQIELDRQGREISRAASEEDRLLAIARQENALQVAQVEAGIRDEVESTEQIYRRLNGETEGVARGAEQASETVSTGLNPALSLTEEQLEGLDEGFRALIDSGDVQLERVEAVNEALGEGEGVVADLDETVRDHTEVVDDLATSYGDVATEAERIQTAIGEFPNGDLEVSHELSFAGMDTPNNAFKYDFAPLGDNVKSIKETLDTLGRAIPTAIAGTSNTFNFHEAVDLAAIQSQFGNWLTNQLVQATGAV